MTDWRDAMTPEELREDARRTRNRLAKCCGDCIACSYLRDSAKISELTAEIMEQRQKGST
jgi:hypothetical protein